MKRRTFLRAAALGLTGAMAGCLEEAERELGFNGTELPDVGNLTPPGEGATGTPEPEPGAIEYLFLEERDLVLRLAGDADVDEVKVVDPEGELWDSVTVASGEREARVEMLRNISDPSAYSYVEGAYVAAALSINRDTGVERVGLAEFEAASDLEVRDAGVDEGFRAYVTVANESDVPVRVTYLGFEDVNDPTPPPETDRDTGVVTDTRIRGHSSDGVIVPASGEKRIISDWFPFEISDDEEIPSSFTIVIHTLPRRTIRREFSREEGPSTGTA